MKKKLRDENGYPLNFDPSEYYQGVFEKFYPLPPELYDTEPGKYLVSERGRIFNTETGTFVPRRLIPDKNQYILTAIKNRHNEEIHLGMHQLMTRMFIGEKPVREDGKDMVPNHIDGIKWHNEPYNLEWVTHQENAIHANKNDLIERPYGEDNGYSALTDDQYRQICKLTEEGYLPYQINRMMDLGKNITDIVQKIRTGTSETIISKDYDFSNIPRNDYRKFTEEQVRYICTCLQDHPEMKPIEILRSMGYDVDSMTPDKVKKLRDTISTIKRRVSYIEIGKDYNF